MKKALLYIILTLSLNGLGQVSKTVNCTAGSLSTTLTTNEKITVTNLTVKGTIDARDFKTMRDDMPLLANLDISEVNINSYTGQAGTAGTININYTANEIPERAFSKLNVGGKKSLIAIEFPKTITSIGKWAHESCTGLSTVLIPKLVSTIKGSAFGFCTGITSLVFESPASLTSIDTLALYGCSKLNSLSIPTTVKRIGYFAFINSKAMISVDVNNLNYSSINGLLYNKEQTQLIYCPQDISGTLNIPPTVTIIVDDAFFSCDKITSIVIPPSLKTIDIWAFEKCTGLTTFSIPSTVESIGESAFYNCTGLTSIYCFAQKPIDLSSSKEVFYNVNKTTCKLYVPLGSSILYSLADQWKDFLNIVEFSTTDVKQIEANEICLYLNQVTDGFRIDGLDEESKIVVSDLNGKICISKKVAIDEFVNTSLLTKGLYLICINTNKRSKVMKFVKQ
ncbi:MAG: leucine-rich repeat domain-containing protein [Prolixibacteraceae bacterium]|nr:leucine-rich repeat domain-containing protein [Prolixibacteraceae bacterium]